MSSAPITKQSGQLFQNSSSAIKTFLLTLPTPRNFYFKVSAIKAKQKVVQIRSTSRKLIVVQIPKRFSNRILALSKSSFARRHFYLIFKGVKSLKAWHYRLESLAPEISKKKLIRQQQQQTSDCWRQLISMRWHSMLSEFLNLDHPRHSTYYIEYLLKLSSVQQLIFVDLHMQKSAALHISFSIKA